MRIGKRILKILGWTATTLLLLHVLLLLLLQLPAVQSFITQKAVNFYETKTGTRAEIEEISLHWFKTIHIGGLYLETPNGDTLLYMGSMSTAIDLMSLLDNRVAINTIEIEDLKGNVTQNTADSNFNFSFIIDAFVTADGPSEEVKSGTEQAMDVSIEGISLNEIDVAYEDETSGFKANLDLEALKVDFSEFSLLNEIIHIDVLYLAGTALKYEQLKEIASSEETSDLASAPFPYDIALNELLFERIDLKMKTPDGGYTNCYIGELKSSPKKLDIAKQELAIEELSLAKSRVSLYLPPPTDTLVKELDSPQTLLDALPWDVGWAINISHITIEETDLNYATVKESTTAYFNPDCIAVSDFNTEIIELKMDSSSVGLNIRSCSARERGGLLLKSIKAELYASNTLAYARNLHLELNNSQMDDAIEIHYDSFNELLAQPETAVISADFERNHILPADFRTFVPDLLDTSDWKGWAQLPVEFSGKVEGDEGHLDLTDLSVLAGAETRVAMNGALENVAAPDSLHFAIQIEEFSTTKSDIQLFVPADALDADLPIPSIIQASADVSGNIQDIDGSFDLKTSKGNLKGQGFFKNTSTPSYKASLVANTVDLGFFTGNDSLGITTFQLRANGEGLEPESMYADVQVKVKELNLIEYAYQSFDLNTSIKNQVATLTTAYEDSNLVFDLFGKYDMGDTIVDVNLDVKGADFQRLHLAEDDIRTKFTIKAHTEGINPNTLSGKISVQDIGFRSNNIEYYSDSLVAGAFTKEGKRSIYARSDLFNMKAFGDIHLTELPDALSAYFNRYFETDSSTNKDLALKQNFSYSVDIEKSDIISEILLPGLGEYEPGHVDGRFDGANDLFELHLRVPLVEYDGLELDTFKIDVTSNSETLVADISLLYGQYEEYSIHGFNLNATAGRNVITTHLQVNDAENALKYDLSAKVYPDPEGMRIVLDEKNTLDHEEWLANINNELVITDGLFKANSFELLHENESISLQNVEGDNLAIGFKNFGLSSVLNIIEAEQEIASGNVNGEVKLISKNGEQKAFTADIAIPNLALFENEIGALEIRADNKEGGAFALDGKIQGFGNDVTIGGTYTPTLKTQLLDLTIDLQPLSMSTIEALTFNQLTDASGELKGSVSIGGTIDEPEVNGKLTFDNSAFIISYLGSQFKIDQQSIVMDNEGILFQKFIVMDSTDNPLKVNGRMFTDNYADYRFDMNVHADELTVLNTTNESEELYFGKVIMDADIHITGTQLSPKVKMNATIKEGTELSTRIPDDNPTVLEREGLIEFVDLSADTSAILNRKKVNDTIRTSIQELDVTAIINIDEKMVFKMYLDEAAGDYLSLQGGGQMVVGIDPTGNLSFTGRYTIDNGIYQLSFYQLVKRKFDIQKGSYIQWLGDPFKANMNLTASYDKKVSVANLFPGQAEEVEGQASEFAKRVPIRVNLNISEELMKPEIDFDIVLPADEKGAYDGRVDAKLQEMNQTESEVNKQAFGLLVLGAFIPEEQGTSSSSSTEQSARGSVSNVLSSQLNALSDKYIKIVDISVGLESYEGNEGGSTELEVGLSKQFLNDRMEVSVGTNANLEGEETTTTAGGLVGDVSVQYKLTKDGAFKLKGYQSNEFDGLIEGVLVETGFAVIFVKDFNTTKDLFSPRKEPEDNSTEVEEIEDEETENLSDDEELTPVEEPENTEPLEEPTAEPKKETEPEMEKK